MDCREVLQEKGHRLTPQRTLVIDALYGADKHISAEEIYEQLHRRYPYANISTVYRTLELLKKLDLVTETDFGEGRVRYHIAEKSHHHHLVCRNCGKIEDLEESALYPLKNDLLRNYGFDADLMHLAISGLCSECRRKEARKARPAIERVSRETDNVQAKLPLLLDYWVQHNSEHEKELRDWATKAVSVSPDIAQKLHGAATRMAGVSNELMKAKQALPRRKSKEKR
jgi:Fur family transcriptional regulator, ferric uptake regulator